jgi:hypothetical protein
MFSDSVFGNLTQSLSLTATLRDRRQIFDKITNFSQFLHEEIRSQLNLGYAFYHLVRNFLSSRLLSKNLIKTQTIKDLFVVLIKCQTRSVTKREEHKLRALNNEVLRKEYMDLKGI